MKRTILCSILLYTVLQAQVIKHNKHEQLTQEKQKNALEAQLLKDSWINPLSIELDTSKSKNNDETSRSKKAYLHFNQDIFKSGGIYYTIEKGERLKKLAHVDYRASISEQRNEVYRLVLQLQKTDLQLQKQAYLIKNKTLEIEKKQAQYLNSTIDIEELDTAIIEKNELLNTTEDLKISKEEYLQTLKQISSHNYKKIQPAILKLTPMEEYLQNNSTLIRSKLNQEIAKYDQKITRSNYLPKISVYSQIGYEDNTLPKVEDNYYNYGIKLSIPLDYNMNKNNQIAKLKYLISNLEFKLQEENETQTYKTILNMMKGIDRKILNSKLSIKKYESIYALTHDLYEGLLKTKEDLKIIQNRLSSSRLDIGILAIDKQLLLYELKKKTQKRQGNEKTHHL
jgi:outer membrane protein TolC